MGQGKRKNRSKWEIICNLLNFTQHEGNAKKTRIMQRACLDWRNFQRHFEFLLEGGFISELNPELGNYAITEKGKELLKRLKEVEEVLNY